MADAAPKAGSRCAIYTRKSTEEGLEQDFNSLDAQREACAAYILSQQHEGWRPVPDIYDDGGYSGGTMERPALKALLADIAAGKVDVIVVYKVDRLTRSLADFAKIVEVLDANGASFVSVTQSFNTTTSMGRLTLNVLLSFAQFEREVTGERIRDKIAASKAKGVWMGGPVPLGYELGERRLVVNPVEADTVRHIFRRYVELGSGRALVNELDAQGIRSKARTDRNGRSTGNCPLRRGALYALLQNRLYVGEVVHKGQAYPGQHEAIVDRDLFDRVQALLATRRIERRLRTNAREVSPLAGLIFDGFGRPLSPVHSSKQARRYRYYASHVDGSPSRDQPIWRLSAADVEARIIAHLATLIERKAAECIVAGTLSAEEIERLRDMAVGMAASLRTGAGSRLRADLIAIVRRIDVSETQLTLTLDLGSIDPALGSAEPITEVIAISAVRRGRQLRLVIPPDPSSTDARRDPALVKLVAQALSLRGAIDLHPAGTFDELAKTLGYSREHAADLLRMSYLAPDILTAMFEGRQPEGLTRTRLIKTPRLPLDWQAQRALLGFV